MLVREGDLIDGWLLRIEDLDPGLILEAVEADRAGDLASYRRWRTSHPPGLTGRPHDGTVMVTTRHGHLLHMVNDGEHTVDGERIAYPGYPLISAPWVDAPLGEGKVRIRRGAAAVAALRKLGPTPRARRQLHRAFRSSQSQV